MPSSCADGGEEAGRVTMHDMGGWGNQGKNAMQFNCPCLRGHSSLELFSVG